MAFAWLNFDFFWVLFSTSFINLAGVLWSFAGVFRCLIVVPNLCVFISEGFIQLVVVVVVALVLDGVDLVGKADFGCKVSCIILDYVEPWAGVYDCLEAGGGYVLALLK